MLGQIDQLPWRDFGAVGACLVGAGLLIWWLLNHTKDLSKAHKEERDDWRADIKQIATNQDQTVKEVAAKHDQLVKDYMTRFEKLHEDALNSSRER